MKESGLYFTLILAFVLLAPIFLSESFLLLLLASALQIQLNYVFGGSRPVSVSASTPKFRVVHSIF